MKQSKHNVDGKFSWEQKGDQVIVHEEVTAKGQKRQIGVYDISTAIWHNNRRTCLVPKRTKKKIELAYGKDKNALLA